MWGKGIVHMRAFDDEREMLAAQSLYKEKTCPFILWTGREGGPILGALITRGLANEMIRYIDELENEI